MKNQRRYITLLVLVLITLVLVTACQETASRFTDNMIENMEDEVGGAAERSSQRAGDQAGGAICGSPMALALLFLGTPAILLVRKNRTRITKRKAEAISETCQQDLKTDRKFEKAEIDDSYSN